MTNHTSGPEAETEIVRRWADFLVEGSAGDNAERILDDRDRVLRALAAPNATVEIPSDHHDLETHLPAWKRAIEIAHFHAEPPVGPDQHDQAYWDHEMRALERALPAASAALAQQSAEIEELGVRAATLDEALTAKANLLKTAEGRIERLLVALKPLADAASVANGYPNDMLHEFFTELEVQHARDARKVYDEVSQA